MWVIVPMAECGQAEQGKTPERKQEDRKILVLPASQHNGQAGSRQDGYQHPLVKSQICEKTASHEGEGDQHHRHEQAMDSAHPGQGHSHTVQDETPSRDGAGYRSCWFLGHGDQGKNLLDKEKQAS